MRFHKSRGFTLVEIMVAITLLTGTTAAVFGTLVSANKISRVEINRGLPYNLGREKMEELYEGVRQDFWNAAGRPLSLGNSVPENIAIDGRAYVRSYNVSAVPGKAYRRVTMRVTLP